MVGFQNADVGGTQHIGKQGLWLTSEADQRNPCCVVDHTLKQRSRWEDEALEDAAETERKETRYSDSGKSVENSTKGPPGLEHQERSWDGRFKSFDHHILHDFQVRRLERPNQYVWAGVGSCVKRCQLQVTEYVFYFTHRYSLGIFDDKQELAFFMEYVQTSLFDFMKLETPNGNPLTPQNVITCCKDILSGLAYIHSSKEIVLHRDIKVILF